MGTIKQYYKILELGCLMFLDMFLVVYDKPFKETTVYKIQSYTHHRIKFS